MLNNPDPEAGEVQSHGEACLEQSDGDACVEHGHGDASEHEGDGSSCLPAVSREEEQQGGPVFSPRLYIQRYRFVMETLRKKKVKSVVDFGSAECKIFRVLKESSSLQKIAMVDIDQDSLELNEQCIKPALFEYLDRREHPLSAHMYAGSATQMDARIVGYEAASMVELVEHLWPDTLESVASMVFGQLCPRVVVITTPNSEFNVLFPGLTGFRHADHKFEWTRQQFQTWCRDHANQWGYDVEFCGIGDPPDGFEYVGYCSQAAIFERLDENIEPCKCESQPYALISECFYPCRGPDQLSEADRLSMEVQYELNQFQKCVTYFDDDDNCVIPLDKLYGMKSINTICEIDKLRLYLRDNGYRLSEDETAVILPPSSNHWSSCSSSSDDDDGFSDQVHEIQCCDNPNLWQGTDPDAAQNLCGMDVGDGCKDWDSLCSKNDSKISVETSLTLEDENTSS